MKKTTWLLILTAAVYGCKKDSASQPASPGANCQLIKITQGFHNDSIQHIQYDSQGRISLIDDSVSQTTNLALYDNNGLLTKITSNAGFAPVTIAYNIQGAPATIVNDYGIAKFTYTYDYGANALPARRVFVTTYPDGSPAATEYRKYSYNGNNIVRTLDYAPADSSDYAVVTEYSYAADSNVFKPFILFQLDVLYGYKEIMDLDYYFNYHLVANTIVYNKLSPNKKEVTVNTYTQDSLHNITGSTTRIISTDPLNSHLFTRQFFYICR